MGKDSLTTNSTSIPILTEDRRQKTEECCVAEIYQPDQAKLEWFICQKVCVQQSVPSRTDTHKVISLYPAKLDRHQGKKELLKYADSCVGYFNCEVSSSILSRYYKGIGGDCDNLVVTHERL